MDVLMDDTFSGFAEEFLAVVEWQHRVEVLREETSKVEREQNGTEQNGSGAQ